MMDDYISAMYASDDDEDFNEDENLVVKREPELELKDKTTLIPIGGKHVEVPNVKYVRALELRVEELKREERRNKFQINQLKSTLKNLIRTVEQQGRDLDNKLNIRDL